MAKARKTALLEELSGSIGDLVLKRARSGTMYVARKPRFPENRQFSPAQLAHQQRFKAATAYAKQAAKVEPLYAALARKTRQPAYNVALGDYLHPPQIVMVEQIGETIRVRAEDQVKVTRVSVALLEADGHILAEGEAAPDSTGWWWTFTANHITAAHDAVARIRVCAYDLPGNETVWEGNYIFE